MKSLLIFLTCIIGSFDPSLRSHQDTKYNLEDLRIKGSNNITLKIDDNESQLFSALGQPTSSEDFYFEMDEKNGKLYQYGANKVFLAEGKLFTWRILNNSIALGRNGHFFRVGQPVSEVFKAFPEHQQKIIDGWLMIPLRTASYDMECTTVKIEVVNGIVTSFHRYDC